MCNFILKVVLTQKMLVEEVEEDMVAKMKTMNKDKKKQGEN